MKLSGTNMQHFIYTMRFHACILDIKTLRKISKEHIISSLIVIIPSQSTRPRWILIQEFLTQHDINKCQFLIFFLYQ